MSKTDWKAELTRTMCRGNINKIAHELRTLTCEELHDDDVAFEIAFERACDIVQEPGALHTYYMSVYRDYITKTVKFEDIMRKQFCYKSGYSIGLSEQVIGAVIRLMTDFAGSSEEDWVSKDWLFRTAERATRMCNLDLYEKELFRYMRTIQKVLTKNIQIMRRTENGKTKTE